MIRFCPKKWDKIFFIPFWLLIAADIPDGDVEREVITANNGVRDGRHTQLGPWACCWCAHFEGWVGSTYFYLARGILDFIPFFIPFCGESTAIYGMVGK